MLTTNGVCSLKIFNMYYIKKNKSRECYGGKELIVYINKE